ncbi:hypothetical protein E2562_019686 [Oryza meyeriana var. granulata]|uniref:Uncharacterized protein n=1 Tax=Oryza meyeriana var. granulata TaxID=110450 RepID=A0A6G1C6V3_9ORYZ|nr:hypothetical protein E2562_019686 [Oryza meyeriana var. granulata]
MEEQIEPAEYFGGGLDASPHHPVLPLRSSTRAAHRSMRPLARATSPAGKDGPQRPLLEIGGVAGREDEQELAGRCLPDLCHELIGSAAAPICNAVEGLVGPPPQFAPHQMSAVKS